MQGQDLNQWSIQRTHPRFSFDIGVSLVTPEPDKRLYRGRMVDLSLGGVSIRLPVDLEVGMIVQLELQLPLEKEPARLRAIVRNRLITRYGFEFLNASPQLLAQLQRTCQTLALGKNS